MDTHTYDALDRQVLHALQIDGRAPFSRIGEVLDVSGQTVARRYTALRESGALRVLGMTDPELLGEVLWIARVHCTPDAAGAVADALARRKDTSWVQLTSGGTDIVCVIRTNDDSDPNTLLLRKLPRTPSVLNVTAHCVLHIFLGGGYGLLHKADILSEVQIQLLRRPAPTATKVDLDDEDHRFLAVLRGDGRAALGDLAKATGWSLTTVRRRMTELRASGLLYFDIDFAPRMLGLGVHALLWLSVEPAELEVVGKTMAEEHPEIAYVAATTGSTNLLASVVCPTVKDLYSYLTRKIAVLPGISGIETAPVVHTVKNAVTLSAR